MPTVLLLDLSMSMMRPASVHGVRQAGHRVASDEGGDDDEVEDGSCLLWDLAMDGIGYLLNHLEKHHKLEQVCLMGYSSQCEVVCGFTRDMAEIHEKLKSLECFASTNIVSALSGLSSYVQEQWTNSVPVNVILITDEGATYGPNSLDKVASSCGHNHIFPLKFACRMHIVCISSVDQAQLEQSRRAFQKLMQKAAVDGQVLMPEQKKGGLTKASVRRSFQNVIESQYQEFSGTLKLSEELSCPVTVYPPPAVCKRLLDFEVIEAKVSEELSVKGFISISDICSPPVVSRHLVLPDSEDVRSPSLCVFLHGALKVENMCAIVQISCQPAWFAMMFSWSDTKKKSNLMLALFEPGPCPVPWLGDLHQLGPLADLNETSSSPFPVQASQQKPSYSTSPVVWIKKASLLGDVQKIMRNARRLPEKTNHLYKELNRLKQAALIRAFHELLEIVASILDRELVMQPSAHQEYRAQLANVAEELRSKKCLKLDYVLGAASRSR